MGSQSPDSPYTSLLQANLPDLKSYEDLYKHFHRNPEISTLETETSAKILSILKDLNTQHNSALEIKSPIGGTGIIAIHRNGPGKTLLLRADIDGLPILERTGLNYASTKTMVDTHLGNNNHPVPTMHACGHDFHITSLLAAIETLLKAQSSWSGTLIYLFQPAEERACGAQMMLDDGLYTTHACPEPDIVLGQHVFPYRAGTIHSTPGPAMSAADSFKITIHGRGGHGSMPHRTIDPVVIASQIVVRLQTIVSREIPPDQTAVVTVGSIKAGDTVNVISDLATLQVNIRSFDEYWRKAILDSLKRIVEGECAIGRCPKPPEFEDLHAFPLTENDASVTEQVERAFGKHFGARHMPNMKPVAGSEDFSHLARSVGKPYMFWFFGGVDPEEWERREKDGTLEEVPVNHSPFFAPCVQPTLRTGVEAMVVGALAFVGKGEK